jgi:uncharacterized membrane protein
MLLSRLRRFNQVFIDDAVISFLKIVGWLLVPVAFALLGLVLLTSVLTALIWVAFIVVFVLLYVRFSDKHVEHSEYDDKLEGQRWVAGREKYFKMLETDENRDGKKE